MYYIRHGCEMCVKHFMNVYGIGVHIFMKPLHKMSSDFGPFRYRAHSGDNKE